MPLSQSDKDKVVRLLTYLRKLASMRIPPVRDLNSYERIVWIADITDLPLIPGRCSCIWHAEADSADENWLVIQNESKPKVPKCPDNCIEWVTPDVLEDPRSRPYLKPERETPDGSILNLSDYPEIQTAFENYLDDEWTAWCDSYKQWEKTHAIYTALFNIHQEQLRLDDELELILGLGLLTFTDTEGQVLRHLIEAKASLDFDPTAGKFTVQCDVDGAKFRVETDFLSSPITDKSFSEFLHEANDDPMHEAIKDALKGLVHVLDSSGEFHDVIRRVHP